MQLRLQVDRVFRRLDLLGVLHVVLLPHFIHDLHDDQALLKALVLAFLSTISEGIRALVGFPVHTLTLTLALPASTKAVLPATSLARTRELPVLLLDRAILVDELGLGGTVGWVEDLHLAIRSLDADRWASSALSIRVCCNAHASGSDTVCITTLLAWEGKQHARVLVRASLVLANGAQHAAWWLRVLLCGVECLEDPRKGVDSEIQQSTTSKIGVDHAVGVGECILRCHGHAEVGGRTVDGADFAGSDDIADVDGEGEVTGPDLVGNVSERHKTLTNV